MMFTAAQRKLVTTYIHSRVGQVPEAVAALLADYDRLRGQEDPAINEYDEDEA